MNFFTDYLAISAYMGLFFGLLVSAIGVPLPEEIVIATGGVLSYEGAVNPFLAGAVCLTSIMLGDSFLYWAGYHFGYQVFKMRGFRVFVGARRLRRLEKFFNKHGAWTVFFMRFLTGLRAPTFLVAGASRVPYRKFLLIDCAGALSTITILISLGYSFGEPVSRWLEGFDRIESYAIFGILFAILVVIVARIIYLRHSNSRPEGQHEGSFDTDRSHRGGV